MSNNLKGPKMYRLERHMVAYPDDPKTENEVLFSLYSEDLEGMTLEDLRALAGIITDTLEQEDYLRERQKEKKKKK